VVNLPENYEVFYDDALEAMTNFETWTNKTHYHTINTNRWRDLPKPEKFYDLKEAKIWDINPATWKIWKTEKACEVGNIFPLETKYSKILDFTVTTSDNTKVNPIMWSYGIGPSRCMGVIVEKHHDEKGILRPEHIAPFQYCIIGIWDEWLEEATKLYETMLEDEYDVCLDDRNVGPGFKFKDADLIWYPWQIVIGKKTLAQDQSCELVERKTGEKKLVKISELLEIL
jgi:prolyl-tRNA synthetase